MRCLGRKSGGNQHGRRHELQAEYSLLRLGFCQVYSWYLSQLQLRPGCAGAGVL